MTSLLNSCRAWRDAFYKRLCGRPKGFMAVNGDDVLWRGGLQPSAPVTLFLKPLFEDIDGQEVVLVRYPAGQVNPDHVHAVGHGMFVLQGKLLTHKGTYGANSFVWFPAGQVMRHGATADEDVVVLFIHTGALKTKYLRQP